MSNRRIPLLPAFVVAGALACGFSAARAAAGALPEDNEVVHLAMEGMKSSLKKLAGALNAGGRRDDALAAVTALQRHTLEAKAGAPSNLADKPEAERAAHALAYRRELALLLGELAALEVEVVDGEDAAALARIETKLLPLREGAHGRFQRE